MRVIFQNVEIQEFFLKDGCFIIFEIIDFFSKQRLRLSFCMDKCDSQKEYNIINESLLLKQPHQGKDWYTYTQMGERENNIKNWHRRTFGI